jgi:hypothetical protein
MSQTMSRAQSLRRSITNEAFSAMGLGPGSWQERLARPLFDIPAGRFARLASAWDEQIDRNGAAAGCRWLLPRLARDIQVRGAETIPASGPVLLVSNHPGAFDGVTIIANLPRDDFKIIISDVPFFRMMTGASRYMIYMNWGQPQDRTQTVRSAIRWLQSGGLLFIFPSGLVNPDPACMPGVEESLATWSNSIDLFLRKAPGARLVCAAISGVITKRFLDNPFARRQKTDEQRIKTAEYLEFAQLMLIQRDLGLNPRLSFAEPITADELLSTAGGNDLHQAIVQRQRNLISDHLAAFY